VCQKNVCEFLHARAFLFQLRALAKTKMFTTKSNAVIKNPSVLIVITCIVRRSNTFSPQPISPLIQRQALSSISKCTRTAPKLDSGNRYGFFQGKESYAINPITNRRIQVGKSRWNDLMSEGGWIYHQGNLSRLGLDKFTLSCDQLPTVAEDTLECKVMAEKLVRIEPSIIDYSADFTEETNKVIHEDVLFIDKPSGLLSVCGRGPDKSDCLTTRVQALFPNAKPCHRLDRDTSGIVVFGLTSQAHSDISKQFQDRTTVKSYTALVAGHFSVESGVVELAIGKEQSDDGYNRWVIGGEKSRMSRTEWKVDKSFVEKGHKWSRVILFPLTGRGHQIRLHMAAIGHPILGDMLHAPTNVALTSPRLCLHANQLQISYQGCRLIAQSVCPF